MSPRARPSNPPRDHTAATSSSSQQYEDGNFVGEEQGEEEEPADDPPIDPDPQAATLPTASRPESSISLLTTSSLSALPATSPSPRALGTPSITDSALEKELEDELSPGVAVAAGYKLPDPPVLAEAGRVAEV